MSPSSVAAACSSKLKLRQNRLRNANLSRYQVLILPLMSGSGYEEALGEGGIENIKDWVQDGGVLIGLGNATRFLADPDVDLLAVRRERAVVELEEVPEEDDDEESTVEGQYLTSAEQYQEQTIALEDDPDAVSSSAVTPSGVMPVWA